MTTYYGVGTSHDGRWLVVSASAGTAPRTDVWLADLLSGDPAAPSFREVAVGLDAEHGVWVGRDGRLYVHTDLDAPRGRLCVADPADPGPARWVDLLPQDPTAVLSGLAVLDSPSLAEPLLLVQRTRHAIGELSVHRLADGTLVREVDLPGLGSLGGLVTAYEDRDAAWFTWTDSTTPGRVLRLDGRTLEVTTAELPPGEPPAGPEVVAQQLSCASADGTTVRFLVLARADALREGRPQAPAPTLLYGYGGFGISLTPGYSATTLAWVRAGGVHVVAGLRGGGEEGEDWHRDGYRDRKQNVFDDLFAVADALVEQGWTTPDRLAVSGGSNGGLLVGTALTQRPAAWAAVLCSAPLLDMVRYEHHGLGVSWNDEYGTAADPVELGWLLSYSPVPPRRGGHPLPGGAVHGLRRGQPGRPAARPQAGRRPAARHQRRPAGTAGPAAAGGRRRPRRPIGVPDDRPGDRRAAVPRPPHRPGLAGGPRRRARHRWLAWAAMLSPSPALAAVSSATTPTPEPTPTGALRNAADQLVSDVTDQRCGTQDGTLCSLLYRATGDIDQAKFLSGLISVPLFVLAVLLVAAVVRYVLRRAIRRWVDGIENEARAVAAGSTCSSPRTRSAASGGCSGRRRSARSSGGGVHRGVDRRGVHDPAGAGRGHHRPGGGRRASSASRWASAPRPWSRTSCPACS
jgi:hypothetical protein